MTNEQEQFVSMLEDKGLVPNLTMEKDGENWTLVEIELRLGSHVVGLTFNPDGKLIEVDID